MAAPGWRWRGAHVTAASAWTPHSALRWQANIKSYAERLLDLESIELKCHLSWPG